MDNLLNDPGARTINEVLGRHGHECYFVGGAPRDALLGMIPKDIDLATSATPDEMIAAFATDRRTKNVILTGEKHGTITVVIQSIPYEITTYRIDRETDGRHAVVEYTRNLRDDLARRDLTVNAIAVGFDGEIVDPFGGVADLAAGVVRFVGMAEDRLREDYLRILRWFRFYGRFAKQTDQSAVEAISATAPGLAQISVERIWSEVAKIITGPNADTVMSIMVGTGVADQIGLTNLNRDVLRGETYRTLPPAVVMSCLLGGAVRDLAERWKWSKEDHRIADFTINRVVAPYTLVQAKADMVARPGDRKLAEMVAVLKGNDELRRAIAAWDIPTLPVSGKILFEAGVQGGPRMGAILREMNRVWAESDYQMGRDDLLPIIATVE